MPSNNHDTSLNYPIIDIESTENENNGLRAEYLSRITNSCRNMGQYGDFDIRWMAGYLVLIIVAIIAYVRLF
jgi:hypothetical protein